MYQAICVAPNRRGTVLILVLGLITLFMALMLSATVRVYNSGKAIGALQRSVNAHLMMQAAKMYLAKGGSTPVTIGDTYSPADFPSYPAANRMTWVHINGTNVVAAGGSTGGFPAGKSTIFSTDPARSPVENQISNLFEIRYRYTISAGGVVLKSVDDNTLYPW